MTNARKAQIRRQFADHAVFYDAGEVVQELLDEVERLERRLKQQSAWPDRTPPHFGCADCYWTGEVMNHHNGETYPCKCVGAK